MTRNKDETRQRILDAALQELLEEGFGGFGVNTIARRAGCDKKLIYRYFDGLDGLVEAMGAAAAEGLEQALAPHLEPPPASYAELMERLSLALFDHLSDDALYRQIKLMEVSAPPAMTEKFRSARGTALRGWVQAARGDLVPPGGVDTGATNAALIATVEGLTILGPAGMDVSETTTRPRLRVVIRDMVRAAYR